MLKETILEGLPLVPKPLNPTCLLNTVVWGVSGLVLWVFDFLNSYVFESVRKSVERSLSSVSYMPQLRHHVRDSIVTGIPIQC